MMKKVPCLRKAGRGPGLTQHKKKDEDHCCEEHGPNFHDAEESVERPEGERAG